MQKCKRITELVINQKSQFFENANKLINKKQDSK